VPLVAGTVIVVALIAVAIVLSLRALGEIRQLRRELDETQRQLNELKAATDLMATPPPPLPRTRSSGLEDLRQQLRAAHREEGSEE